MTASLPKKNQPVTVRLADNHGLFGSRGAPFTALVATVSKANSEFAIVINGAKLWFGADEWQAVSP